MRSGGFFTGNGARTAIKPDSLGSLETKIMELAAFTKVADAMVHEHGSSFHGGRFPSSAICRPSAFDGAVSVGVTEVTGSFERNCLAEEDFHGSMEPLMATIKEIAHIAKTSTATVSYVLSGKPARISQNTRERILKVAKELDYQPNALVHALRSKISYAIAVLVPGLTTSFFPEIISGIDSVVSEAGFQLMICQHTGSPEKLHREIAVLRSRRVDGLIVGPSGLPDQEAYFSDLRKKNVNLVLIADSQSGIPFATVDELLGMRMVIENLHKLGHRSIGYVGPRAKRLDIFCQAMRERDLPIKESQLLTFEDSGPTAEQFHAYLQRKPRVTALVAQQDSLFFPLYEYSRKSGLRIPADLSIIGCGNLRESAILWPPLASIDQVSSAIGREAGRIMLDLILARIPLATHQMTLKPRLIPRETMAAPAAP